MLDVPEEEEPLYEPFDPDNLAYREAAERMHQIMNEAAVWLLQKRLTPATEIALWQVAFAMGLNICNGESMTRIAQRLGCQRAAISKGAVQFAKRTGLPPSPHMREETARKQYTKARIRQLSK